MLKRCLLIYSALISSAGSIVYAEEEIVLPQEEVKSLISGNTIKGTYLDTNIPFTSYFDDDGTVQQKRAGEIRQGEWYINEKGWHCIKWDTKEKQNKNEKKDSEPVKPKCRIVVKDNETYKEIALTKEGKRRYTLIINKIIEGNPDGL